MSRIAPATEPYPQSIHAYLSRLMPEGVEPLVLFRVLARDERLFSRFMGAGLLDKGHLTLTERELTILRVCANYRSEYEWGVHVAMFAAKARLTAEQVEATCSPDRVASCWSERQQLLLALCDELCQSTDVSDALWQALRAEFTEEALLELLLLNCGYRTVSVLTNTLRLPLEAYAARFPDTSGAGA
jgi:alkylhydroperoxidase family enzyme